MFSHLESKWKFDTKMMVLVMIQMSRHSPSPRAGVGCRRQKARHPPAEYLMTLEDLLLLIENMAPTSPIFYELKTIIKVIISGNPNLLLGTRLSCFNKNRMQ